MRLKTNVFFNVFQLLILLSINRLTMGKKYLGTEKHKQQKNRQVRAMYDDEQHISNVAEINLSGIYSYENYLGWRSEERLELIRGQVFKMSPITSVTHQRWCGFMYVKLYEYLSDKKAEVFIAPLDVRLPDRSDQNGDIFTVVQPDIFIVCNLNQLEEKGCLGAPDIVIEILSDGNNWRELTDKFRVYEAAGVKEYWIINPKRKLFFVYRLDKHCSFQSEGANLYSNGHLSSVLPDFKLNLKELLAAGKADLLKYQ